MRIPISCKPVSRYSMHMMNWLDNPHSAYVVVAYAVAGICLLGLLLLSWRQSAKRAAEWQRQQKQRER